MDKLLDLFLKTPLAKRYLAGFAERGLIWVLGLAAGWIGMPEGSMSEDIAAFALEAAPLVASLALVALAKKRMKKAEVTIETARTSTAELPRASIDAAVNSMTKAEKNQVLGHAKVDAAISRMEGA